MRDRVVNKKIARALGSAMWMYDLTGGARIGKLHQRLRRDEVLGHMPTLPAERVAGGYLYYDAGADDAGADGEDVRPLERVFIGEPEVPGAYARTVTLSGFSKRQPLQSISTDA